MDSFLKEQCDLDFFHKNKYLRKKCSKCGDYFWTLKKDATICGDRPCVEFSFIGKPEGKKPLTLAEVRNSFLSFFKENNHSILSYPETGNRCPVVARWRTDIYLTIASIADFQPHVTSGVVPPPANPLVISQPCIRLNDLEQVGVSGRHLTMFEMMGHHAFNKNIDEIYFKEDTVRLCDQFFVERIGIPREEINYKEQLWDGGGNAGPCLEVLAGGLEIATLVFMNLKQDDSGEHEINGIKYSQNPLNIVDTGYGLERIAWITRGTDTVYDTVFPDIVDLIKKNSESSTDMQSIYSIADHTKCLAFMLGDGIVPSNVKSGYLARLIIRRTLRFIEKIKLDISLKKLVEMQLEKLSKEFPSLIKRKKQIGEILDIETTKYSETISKGENLVKRILKDKKTLTEDDFVLLYDTHGMSPEIVKNIALKQGIDIEIPENFESKVAELHSHEKKEEIIIEDRVNLPKTEQLFSKDHYLKEFDAKVIWKNKTDDGTEIILDKTAFYPEGGGQPSDLGYLSLNRSKLNVKIAKKEGESIIHLIDGDLKIGDSVKGFIDWDRRYSLMKHHTGTHLVNGALRKLLGEHIWQAGSQLDVNNARFDFVHYKSIDEEEQVKIQNKANDFIKKSVKVEKKVINRNDAEKLYGFRLYQGGVPPGNQIKVLNIPDVDVEACGGTHLNNTSEVEKIRIIKFERIQDGVNRVIFAAGKMADAYKKEEKEIFESIIKVIRDNYSIDEKENISNQLKKVSKLYSVPIDQLPTTFKRFLKESDISSQKKVKDLIQASKDLFKEWKKTQKSKKQVNVNEIEELVSNADLIPGKNIKIIIGKTKSDATVMAGEIVKEDNYIIHLYDGKKLVSMASENINIDLRKIAPEIGKILGGSGGGRPKMTQCGGPNKNQVENALKKAKELTIKELK